MNNDASAKSPFSDLIQIGVVVRNIEEAAKRLTALGIGPFVPTTPPPGAEGLFLCGKPMEIKLKQVCTRMGEVELELIQPGEEKSPWKDFLDNNGEGVQHLGFRVKNVEDAVDKLVEQGATVFVTGIAKGRLQAAYVDLGVGGIIVELMDL